MPPAQHTSQAVIDKETQDKTEMSTLNKHIAFDGGVDGDVNVGNNDVEYATQHEVLDARSAHNMINSHCGQISASNGKSNVQQLLPQQPYVFNELHRHIQPLREPFVFPQSGQIKTQPLQNTSSLSQATIYPRQQPSQQDQLYPSQSELLQQHQQQLYRQQPQNRQPFVPPHQQQQQSQQEPYILPQ